MPLTEMIVAGLAPCTHCNNGSVWVRLSEEEGEWEDCGACEGTMRPTFYVGVDPSRKWEEELSEAGDKMDSRHWVDLERAYAEDCDLVAGDTA